MYAENRTRIQTLKIKTFFSRFHCFVDMQCLVSYIHWSHSVNGLTTLEKNRQQEIMKQLRSFFMFTFVLFLLNSFSEYLIDIKTLSILHMISRQ